MQDQDQEHATKLSDGQLAQATGGYKPVFELLRLDNDAEHGEGADDAPVPVEGTVESPDGRAPGGITSQARHAPNGRTGS